MAEVNGLQELTASIEALTRRLQEQLPHIVATGGDIVFGEIHSRMPSDTGDMAAHLDESPSDRREAAYVTVEIVTSGQGGPEHKAIFQEYGTSNMPASPFFRPGVEAARPRVEAQITADVLKVIAP